MIKNFLLVVFIVFMTSCGGGNSNKITKINWLIGTWKMTTSEGVFIESWSKEYDTIIVGNGFFITRESDTPFKERLSIVQRDNQLYYIAVTKGNDFVSVLFKEKVIAKDELLFENPEHDFPQKIHYRKLNDSNIKVTISGIQKGVPHEEDFNLLKQ